MRVFRRFSYFWALLPREAFASCRDSSPSLSFFFFDPLNVRTVWAETRTAPLPEVPPLGPRRWHFGLVAFFKQRGTGVDSPAGVSMAFTFFPPPRFSVFRFLFSLQPPKNLAFRSSRYSSQCPRSLSLFVLSPFPNLCKDLLSATHDSCSLFTNREEWFPPLFALLWNQGRDLLIRLFRAVLPPAG